MAVRHRFGRVGRSVAGWGGGPSSTPRRDQCSPGAIAARAWHERGASVPRQLAPMRSRNWRSGPHRCPTQGAPLVPFDLRQSETLADTPTDIRGQTVGDAPGHWPTGTGPRKAWRDARSELVASRPPRPAPEPAPAPVPTPVPAPAPTRSHAVLLASTCVPPVSPRVAPRFAPVSMTSPTIHPTSKFASKGPVAAFLIGVILGVLVGVSVALRV
jgi:hypothetical protein